VSAEPARELELGTALRCPRCGATSPADARLCRLCYASLEGATHVAAPTGTRRRPSLRPPSTLRGWVALAVAVVVLLFAASWVRGWIEGPPPPFPAVGGQRTTGAPGAAWAMPGGALEGGRETAATPVLEGPSWRWEASSAPTTPAVTDGDALYLGLEEGVLVSIGAADGLERWRARVPGVLESAPAIAEGRLYAGYRSGGVAALDAASGDPVWEAQLGVSISTTPLVVDGIVFVAGNGVLGGFDAEDGTQIWERQIDDSVVPVTPVIDGETLVVATFDRVLLIDRHNGELLSWTRLSPEHAPISALALRDGVAFVVADGRVMAVSTSMRRPWWDGVRPVWEFLHVLGAAPDPPWRPDLWTVDTPPGRARNAIAGQLVVVAGSRGVRAYELASGALAWAAAVDAPGAAPVATAAGVLIAGLGEGWLLDHRDGRVLAAWEFEGEAIDALTVEFGSFVITREGIAAFLGDR
jgi:outer membrane protein assembly factor BamB